MNKKKTEQYNLTQVVAGETFLSNYSDLLIQTMPKKKRKKATREAIGFLESVSNAIAKELTGKKGKISLVNQALAYETLYRQSSAFIAKKVLKKEPNMKYLLPEKSDKWRLKALRRNLRKIRKIAKRS